MGIQLCEYMENHWIVRVFERVNFTVYELHLNKPFLLS